MEQWLPWPPPTRWKHYRQSNLGWLIVATAVGLASSAPQWIGWFTLTDFSAWVMSLWPWPPLPWYVSIIAVLTILCAGAIEGSFRLAKRDSAEFDRERSDLIDKFQTVERERDTLAQQIHVRKKNQEIVNALIPQVREGVWLEHKVRKMTSPADSATWKDLSEKWRLETLALLERFGCTPNEISSFSDITNADVMSYATLHPQELFNKRMAWTHFRVLKLRRIVDTYSESQVFFD